MLLSVALSVYYWIFILERYYMMNKVYLVTYYNFTNDVEGIEIDRAFNEYYNAVDYVNDMKLKMKEFKFSISELDLY